MSYSNDSIIIKQRIGMIQRCSNIAKTIWALIAGNLAKGNHLARVYQNVIMKNVQKILI